MEILAIALVVWAVLAILAIMFVAGSARLRAQEEAVQEDYLSVWGDVLS